jgi:hypothetical protein
MELIKDDIIFRVDKWTEYDDYSILTIEFSYTPIGYMDRSIESRMEAIHNEYDLEQFAEEWLKHNKI